MRKIFLGLAVAAGFVMSCQKVREGSNKSVLRMEEEKSGALGFPYDAGAQNAERVHTVATGVEGVEKDSLRTATVEEVSISTDSTRAVGSSAH